MDKSALAIAPRATLHTRMGCADLFELLLDLFLIEVVRHRQDLDGLSSLAAVRVVCQRTDAAYDIAEYCRSDHHNYGSVGALLVHNRLNVSVAFRRPHIGVLSVKTTGLG